MNKTAAIFYGLVIIAIGILFYYFWSEIKDFFKKAGDQAKDVGNYLLHDAFNVTSDKNIFTVAANTGYQAVTGSAGTIGTDAYGGITNIGDLIRSLGGGPPDSSYTTPEVIKVCQVNKDQGKNINGAPACKWLNDNGYLQ